MKTTTENGLFERVMMVAEAKASPSPCWSGDYCGICAGDLTDGICTDPTCRTRIRTSMLCELVEVAS
jgi:ferredoxin